MLLNNFLSHPRHKYSPWQSRFLAWLAQKNSLGSHWWLKQCQFNLVLIGVFKGKRLKSVNRSWGAEKLLQDIFKN